MKINILRILLSIFLLFVWRVKDSLYIHEQCQPSRGHLKENLPLMDSSKFSGKSPAILIDGVLVVNLLIFGKKWWVPSGWFHNFWTKVKEFLPNFFKIDGLPWKLCWRGHWICAYNDRLLSDPKSGKLLIYLIKGFHKLPESGWGQEHPRFGKINL